MTLLLNLYLGHLLGDFVLQPGWLVVAKRRGVAGLLLHVGIIGTCTAIILFRDLSSLWNIVLLVMAAHVAIEVITIRARMGTSLSGLSVFLVDQALHITSIVLLVALAEAQTNPEGIATFGYAMSTAMVAFLCALVAVTFMGAIIVFEINNSVGPDSWNMELLPYDFGRVAGMVERGASLALGVLVHPALLFVPFLPRIILALAKKPEERARQMLIATTGLVVCTVGWALVAGVALAARYP